MSLSTPVRSAAPSLILAVALLSHARISSAQDVDLIEAKIDEIVNGSSPKEEKSTPAGPAQTSQPPTAPPQTLSGGIKFETRPDGTRVFTRPDGTVQYVSRDGRTVSVLPDGQRVLEEPGQKPQYRAPQVDDPSNYRAHAQPPTTPPAPTTPPPDDPLPDVTIPDDPPDSGGRHHATWSDLESGDHGDPSPATTLGTPAEPRPRYTPPPPGAGDRLIMSGNQTFGKSSVYTYESGATQVVLKDGRSVVTYPGIPEVSVRDASGNVTAVKPGADGLIRVPGGDTSVTVDPGDGRFYLNYPNDLRETIGRDGSWALSDGKGGTEWRGADGRVTRSQVEDAATGYTIRQDRDGVAIVLKDGQPVGIGTRELGGYKFRDKDGKEIVMSEILDLKRNPSTVAAQQAIAAGYNQPARGGNASPPQPTRIFDLVKPQLERLRKEQDVLRAGSGNDGAMTPRVRGESDLSWFMRQTEARFRSGEQAARRLEALAKAIQDVSAPQPGDKTQADLDRVLKLADATLKKSDMDRQLKQDEGRLASQKSALQEEKQRVDSQKAQLLLRETRAANMKKQASDDKFSLSIVRNGLLQQEIVLDGADNLLKMREAKAKNALEDALKRVDYSKYNRCPEQHPWKECGHADIKKKWLNEQLAALLGPAGVAELKKVTQERKALDQQLKELKGKQADLKQKEAADDDLAKRATGQADTLKAERDRLDARSNSIQKQVDQAQSQVDRDRKQMADLEEAIKKYSSPPQ